MLESLDVAHLRLFLVSGSLFGLGLSVVLVLVHIEKLGLVHET